MAQRCLEILLLLVMAGEGVVGLQCRGLLCHILEASVLLERKQES